METEEIMVAEAENEDRSDEMFEEEEPKSSGGLGLIIGAAVLAGVGLCKLGGVVVNKIHSRRKENPKECADNAVAFSTADDAEIGDVREWK